MARDLIILRRSAHMLWQQLLLVTLASAQVNVNFEGEMLAQESSRVSQRAAVVAPSAGWEPWRRRTSLSGLEAAARPLTNGDQWPADLPPAPVLARPADPRSGRFPDLRFAPHQFQWRPPLPTAAPLSPHVSVIPGRGDTTEQYSRRRRPTIQPPPDTPQRGYPGRGRQRRPVSSSPGFRQDAGAGAARVAQIRSQAASETSGRRVVSGARAEQEQDSGLRPAGHRPPVPWRRAEELKEEEEEVDEGRWTTAQPQWRRRRPRPSTEAPVAFEAALETGSEVPPVPSLNYAHLALGALAAVKASAGPQRVQQNSDFGSLEDRRRLTTTQPEWSDYDDAPRATSSPTAGTRKAIRTRYRYNTTPRNFAKQDFVTTGDYSNSWPPKTTTELSLLTVFDAPRISTLGYGAHTRRPAITTETEQRTTDRDTYRVYFEQGFMTTPSDTDYSSPSYTTSQNLREAEYPLPEATGERSDNNRPLDVTFPGVTARTPTITRTDEFSRTDDLLPSPLSYENEPSLRTQLEAAPGAKDTLPRSRSEMSAVTQQNLRELLATTETVPRGLPEIGETYSGASSGTYPPQLPGVTTSLPSVSFETNDTTVQTRREEPQQTLPVTTETFPTALSDKREALLWTFSRTNSEEFLKTNERLTSTPQQTRGTSMSPLWQDITQAPTEVTESISNLSTLSPTETPADTVLNIEEKFPSVPPASETGIKDTFQDIKHSSDWTKSTASIGNFSATTTQEPKTTEIPLDYEYYAYDGEELYYEYDENQPVEEDGIVARSDNFDTHLKTFIDRSDDFDYRTDNYLEPHENTTDLPVSLPILNTYLDFDQDEAEEAGNTGDTVGDLLNDGTARPITSPGKSSRTPDTDEIRQEQRPFSTTESIALAATQYHPGNGRGNSIREQSSDSRSQSAKDSDVWEYGTNLLLQNESNERGNDARTQPETQGEPILPETPQLDINEEYYYYDDAESDDVLYSATDDTSSKIDDFTPLYDLEMSASTTEKSNQEHVPPHIARLSANNEAGSYYLEPEMSEEPESALAHTSPISTTKQEAPEPVTETNAGSFVLEINEHLGSHSQIVGDTQQDSQSIGTTTQATQTNKPEDPVTNTYTTSMAFLSTAGKTTTEEIQVKKSGSSPSYHDHDASQPPYQQTTTQSLSGSPNKATHSPNTDTSSVGAVGYDETTPHEMNTTPKISGTSERGWRQGLTASPAIRTAAPAKTDIYLFSNFPEFVPGEETGNSQDDVHVPNGSSNADTDEEDDTIDGEIDGETTHPHIDGETTTTVVDMSITDDKSSTAFEERRTINVETSTSDGEMGIPGEELSTTDDDVGKIDEKNGVIDVETSTVDVKSDTIDVETSTVDEKSDTIDERSGTNYEETDFSDREISTKKTTLSTAEPATPVESSPENLPEVSSTSNKSLENGPEGNAGKSDKQPASSEKDFTDGFTSQTGKQISTTSASPGSTITRKPIPKLIDRPKFSKYFRFGKEKELTVNTPEKSVAENDKKRTHPDISTPTADAQEKNATAPVTSSSAVPKPPPGWVSLEEEVTDKPKLGEIHSEKPTLAEVRAAIQPFSLAEMLVESGQSLAEFLSSQYTMEDVQYVIKRLQARRDGQPLPDDPRTSSTSPKPIPEAVTKAAEPVTVAETQQLSTSTGSPSQTSEDEDLTHNNEAPLDPPHSELNGFSNYSEPGAEEATSSQERHSSPEISDHSRVQWSLVEILEKENLSLPQFLSQGGDVQQLMLQYNGGKENSTDTIKSNEGNVITEFSSNIAEEDSPTSVSGTLQEYRAEEVTTVSTSTSTTTKTYSLAEILGMKEMTLKEFISSGGSVQQIMQEYNGADWHPPARSATAATTTTTQIPAFLTRPTSATAATTTTTQIPAFLTRPTSASNSGVQTPQQSRGTAVGGDAGTGQDRPGAGQQAVPPAVYILQTPAPPVYGRPAPGVVGVPLGTAGFPAPAGIPPAPTVTSPSSDLYERINVDMETAWAAAGGGVGGGGDQRTVDSTVFDVELAATAGRGGNPALWHAAIAAAAFGGCALLVFLGLLVYSRWRQQAEPTPSRVVPTASVNSERSCSPLEPSLINVHNYANAYRHKPAGSGFWGSLRKTFNQRYAAAYSDSPYGCHSS